jgi:ATP phosphoribosyltransferase
VSAELEFTNDIIPPLLYSSTVEANTDVFRKAYFKFALQKNGELTAISLQTIKKVFAVDVGEFLDGAQRRLFTVTEDGVGIAFIRNKAICQLVANRSIDAALVGLDQVHESGFKGSLEILRELPELGQWDIVLATPKDSDIKSVFDLLLIATQYPAIAQAFFEHIGHSGVTIIQSQGSTELLSLLTHQGKAIDGIVDLRVSGKTLQANGMVAWEPAVTKVYPVLVANREALLSPEKQPYFDKLMKE